MERRLVGDVTLEKLAEVVGGVKDGDVVNIKDGEDNLYQVSI